MIKYLLLRLPSERAVKDIAAKTSLRVNSAMQTGQVPKFLALKCQVLQALNTEQGPTGMFFSIFGGFGSGMEKKHLVGGSFK